MALVLLGRTKCCLCKEVLKKDVGGFPAFLPYGHRYGWCSDAAFHKSCFDAHPDAEAINKLWLEYEAIIDARPRGLKDIEAIDEWTREAFKNWPPKEPA